MGRLQAALAAVEAAGRAGARFQPYPQGSFRGPMRGGEPVKREFHKGSSDGAIRRDGPPIPFGRTVRPRTCSVLSAAPLDTTLHPAARPLCLTGRRFTPLITTGDLSVATLDASCASSGISVVNPPVADGTVMAAPKGTTAHIVVPPTIMPLVSGVSERDRIITPYRADVFESELRKFGLFQKYPSLPNKFRFGFPIGDFEFLPQTFTPKNHSSSIEHIDFVLKYVAEQVSIGRMTGPYTRLHVESILRSKFVSSPISVVRDASSSKLRLVQNCSYRGERGIFVNDHIDSDNFLTTWGTAAMVAEIVRDSSLVSWS